MAAEKKTDSFLFTYIDGDEYMAKHIHLEMQELFEDPLFVCLFIFHYKSSIDKDSCFYQ